MGLREYEEELWNSLKQGVSLGQLRGSQGLCCGFMLRSKLGDVKLL